MDLTQFDFTERPLIPFELVIGSVKPKDKDHYVASTNCSISCTRENLKDEMSAYHLRVSLENAFNKTIMVGGMVLKENPKNSKALYEFVTTKKEEFIESLFEKLTSSKERFDRIVFIMVSDVLGGYLIEAYAQAQFKFLPNVSSCLLVKAEIDYE